MFLISQNLCAPSPFLSSPSPADSIVGFLMSSLGSGEKGERAGGQERGREGEREVTGRTWGRRGDGAEEGNRPPTDHPTKEQTAAAAVVDVGDEDHIAAYIHYPNTFSIVAGITPLGRSLASRLLHP